ncbi:hypothetical protein [Kytococcus sedentarius]|uniref:hypothetical protein n=1 Tax=Kytococcus sedentarius TaxID=1276 RepID=UPI00384D0F9A
MNALVARLASWEPDVITIEALPGEQVAMMRDLGGPYADLRVGGFPHAIACAEASAFTGDLWAARRAGGDARLPRAHRIDAWAAAYEPHTALLLAAGRPEDVDGLALGLTEALVALRDAGTEAWRVAGAVAMERGLERLHPFDDHTHWAAFTDEDETPLVALMEAASPVAQQKPGYRLGEEVVARTLGSDDLWEQWRPLNTPEAGAALEELESGTWLDLPGHEPIARKQLAGWHARNLLMAGHLRRVTGDHPGGRVMALVGNSHKRPLEIALARGQRDVEIVDVAELDD